MTERERKERERVCVLSIHDIVLLSMLARKLTDLHIYGHQSECMVHVNVVSKMIYLCFYTLNWPCAL